MRKVVGLFALSIGFALIVNILNLLTNFIFLMMMLVFLSVFCFVCAIVVAFENYIKKTVR